MADSNDGVICIEVQSDGKIILGGEFSDIWGTSRANIARFNPDGTLDSTFNPNPNGTVNSIAIQTDGRIVLGGGFTSLAGTQRSHLGRLHADGSLDTGFDSQLLGHGAPTVFSIALRTDGRILIGGSFTNVGGLSRNNIARLNQDGSVDTGFNPDANEVILSMAVQVDGKIVIAGHFTTVGGLVRNYIARVDPNGTPEADFDPNPGGALGEVIYCTVLQADGKILIGGHFRYVGPASGWTARTCFARLNADGTLDPVFDPSVNEISFFGVSQLTGYPIVNSITVQSDGKIIIGGTFAIEGPNPRNFIARYNTDGALDADFNPSTDSVVYATALQADGKVIIGGSFTTVGGVTRNNIARLVNDPATQSLTVPSAHRIQWLRGGASPGTQNVTFELSVNGGSSWTTLGAGTRITGGWTLTSLNLPPRGLIRARARLYGGQFNGNSGLVESIVAFPSVGLTGPTQLGNGTFRFGFTNWIGASFTALATTNLSLPLTNWSVLGPVTEITPGQYQFTDPNAVNLPQRFYQIRSP